MNLFLDWLKRNNSSASVFVIPLVIFIVKEVEVVLRLFGIVVAPPPANGFITNFIAWFGVLYGLLMSMILVRAWQQWDDIDREFSREADKVEILRKDLIFLSNLPSETKYKHIRDEIANLLHKYVKHVINNFKYEIKQLENNKIEDGNQILEKIRDDLNTLVRADIMKIKVFEFIIPELFERLNEIIDIRGYRISLSSQRLFESLRTVALITSILFLVPFYFAGLTQTNISILNVGLIVSATFLVINIHMLIENLDDPFWGLKKIDDEPWKLLLMKMGPDQ